MTGPVALDLALVVVWVIVAAWPTLTRAAARVRAAWLDDSTAARRRTTPGGPQR